MTLFTPGLYDSMMMAASVAFLSAAAFAFFCSVVSDVVVWFSQAVMEVAASSMTMYFNMVTS